MRTSTWIKSIVGYVPAPGQFQLVFTLLLLFLIAADLVRDPAVAPSWREVHCS